MNTDEDSFTVRYIDAPRQWGGNCCEKIHHSICYFTVYGCWSLYTNIYDTCLDISMVHIFHRINVYEEELSKYNSKSDTYDDFFVQWLVIKILCNSRRSARE